METKMSFLQWQPKTLKNDKIEKYAYMACSQWNPDKKRSEQIRLYIGRLDGNKKNIIVGKKFAGNENILLTLKEVENAVKDKNGFESWLRNKCLQLSNYKNTNHDKITKVNVVGDCFALMELSDEIKLTETLTKIFGKIKGNALLGLAMHQVATGHALNRTHDWLEQRIIPKDMKNSFTKLGKIYNFIAEIGENINSRDLFLKTWINHHGDNETVLFDTTSISTYSSNLDEGEWGYNRDGEKLEQINFSLAVNKKNNFPLYYRVISGSIPDVKTLENSLEFMEDLGVEIHTISLDRGFYSASNLRDILQRNLQVVIGLPWTSLQAQNLLKTNKQKLETPKRSVHHNGIMLRHIMLPWIVKMGKNQKTKIINAHLFLDQNKRSELVSKFEKIIFNIIENSEQEKFATASEINSWIGENGGKYKKYLTIKQISKNNFCLKRKPNKIAARTSRMGYSIILTSGKEIFSTNPVCVLDNYRARDKVEKLYDSLKNENGQHRLRTGNNNSVYGRFFLNFIALILRSELDKRMKESKIRNRMTTSKLLDELGKIKSVTTASGKTILLEITKKQRELISKLKIKKIT